MWRRKLDSARGRDRLLPSLVRAERAATCRTEGQAAECLGTPKVGGPTRADPFRHDSGGAARRCEPTTKY